MALHILGMDANAEALNSERIQVQRYDLSNVVQSDPMRVEWVEHVSTLLWETSLVTHSGSCMQGVYIWIRNHYPGTCIESRYVEASTSRTNTSNQRCRRNKAIVLVGVSKGLCRSLWREHG